MTDSVQRLPPVLFASRLFFLLSGCFVLGCGTGDDGSPSVGDGGPLDAGCAVPCGTDCCGGGLVCNPTTRKCDRPCQASCGGRDCGPDGCGGSCGSCPAGKTCNEGTGTCGLCKPDCAGKQCGSNGCGGLCGTCPAGKTCDGFGQCAVCAAKTCQAFGKNCGSVSDGCGGTLDCGTCSSGQTCGGGGQPGVCADPGCVKKTCAELGKDCGKLSDGCGGTLDCGTCSAGKTCGGSGTPNVCGQGVCKPETDREFCQRLGKDCGSVADFDNCDSARSVVTCGSCQAPATCGGGGKPSVCGCTGLGDATLCAASGKNCGAATLTDSCNKNRSVSCGACKSPETCGGGGMANVCGCTPETDAALCSRLGAKCGAVAETDNCGRTRSVASCGACQAGLSCYGGTCVSCTQGARCIPSNPCHLGRESCSSSGSTCVDQGTNLSNGTACGSGRVCSSGTCLAGCHVSGKYYATGATAAGNTCQTCQPATSTTQLLNVADGTPCGTGAVCSGGSCRPGCWIAGTFRAEGAASPANACEQCIGANSTTTWTTLADGQTCSSGKVCASGGCTRGCWIAGLLVAEDTVNPSNKCQACLPDQTATQWGNRDGERCASDSVCFGGTCKAGCYCNGTFAGDPQVIRVGSTNSSGCGICDPTISVKCLSPRNQGTRCWYPSGCCGYCAGTSCQFSGCPSAGYCK